MTEDIIEITTETLLFHLSINDTITFALLPQTIISKKKFTIVKITSVKFEESWSYVFHIQNQRHILHLSLEPRQGTIAISRKIPMEEARQLIFQPEKLKKNNRKEIKQWQDREYNKEPIQLEGILHDDDYRSLTQNNPNYIPSSAGKKFAYECFVGQSEFLTADIEIHETAPPQAFLTTILPAHDAIDNIESLRI